MDKKRKTSIMKKVNKSQICQNLSKYQDRILESSRRSGIERRIVSPSPPFYLEYRNNCNNLPSEFCNSVGEISKSINSDMKPLQDKSSCQKWLFWWFFYRT